MPRAVPDQFAPLVLARALARHGAAVRVELVDGKDIPSADTMQRQIVETLDEYFGKLSDEIEV